MKVKISKEELLKRGLVIATVEGFNIEPPDFIELEGEPILAEEEKHCHMCVSAWINCKKCPCHFYVAHTPKSDTPQSLSSTHEVDTPKSGEKCTCGQPTYHEDSCALTKEIKEIADQPKKIEKLVDEFIRDATKVGSMPKSEVRRRLAQLLDAYNKGI